MGFTNIYHQLFYSYFLHFPSVCCGCCRLPMYRQSLLLFSCDFVSDCHECLFKMLNCAVQKDASHSTFFSSPKRLLSVCLPAAIRTL